MMFNKTKHANKKHFCMYCLQNFTTEQILFKHKDNCMVVNGKQAIRMPKERENIVQFKNHQRQMLAPFVIHADFEAITEKIQECEPNNNKSYTDKYQKHASCSYGYKVVCCYDNKYTKQVKIYQGEEPIKKFIEEMLNAVQYCEKIIKTKFKKPLKMSSEDEQHFNAAIECHIWHYFHNLRGYDSHFIMQEIGTIGKEYELYINCIPNNMEKYMAFMLGKHLVFLDSFQFMSSSLDRLLANLPKDKFKYTSEVFKKEKLELMTQKGVYPYDYMDSFERFNETQLPSKDDFFSQITQDAITDEQYCHATKVWGTFNLQTMGDYHDLYLKSDILLLADVFENFRSTCLQYYKLDPCHYYTSPGLSWDAMLKMTDIKLELMTDIDMFQFIEKGTRGGISYIANRYGEANNKYMKEYNKEKPSKYIMYLDANNFFGYAMSQYLPTGGFKWLTEKQIDKIMNKTVRGW